MQKQKNIYLIKIELVEHNQKKTFIHPYFILLNKRKIKQLNEITHFLFIKFCFIISTNFLITVLCIICLYQ